MGDKAKKAPGGFQFVNISKPSDASKHRRQVRSHAARRVRAQEEAAVPPQQPTVSLPREDEAQAILEQSAADVDRDEPWDLTLIPTRPLLGNATPDPSSILSPATVDPFSSWTRPLTPFEGSLLKYFVKNVVVNHLSALPWSETNDPRPALSEPASMMTWTQSAAMDAEIFGPIATKYKAECLRLLNIAIAAEGGNNSDATITKTLAMASEELFDGHKPTADRHLQAAAYMINSRGVAIRLTAWQHHDNIHMWTHWPEIMAGVDSNTICQYSIAHHFKLAMGRSHAQPNHDSTSFEASFEEIHDSTES